MAFEDVKNIPITDVDTTIDVVSLGDGTHDQDLVNVTSAIKLAGDIDSEKDAFLILPLASAAQNQPVVRFVDQHVKDARDFPADAIPRSEYDQELVERLENLSDGTSKKEDKEVATQIGRCAAALSGAVLKVKPGQRDLRIFYQVAAPRVPDAEKQFQLSVIGPLPSFLISPGGSIGVIAALPRRTSVVSAVALTDPSNEGSAIPGRQDFQMGFRTLVGWEWRSDPLFRVRYAYA